MALGFGAVSNTTVLGRPLAFTVPLRMDADEFVSVECVFAEVHAGDTHVPPAQVRVAIDPVRDGGERVLRITTSAMIDEPVVTVEVGLGCPVRLSRKFVAFVDPPVITLAQSAPAEAAQTSAPAPQGTSMQSQSAAIVAPATAPSATRPQAARAPSPQRKAAPPVARPTVLAAPVVAPSARARSEQPRARVAPSATSTGGARLKLETAQAPARALAASQPAASTQPVTSTQAPASTQATATTAQATAAAPAASAAGESQPGLERIRVLEESLARLRTDTDSSRNNIATLQARLREAEASRYANPLVYALVAMVALLLLAMAMLLRWMRARDKQRADWWAASAEDAANRPQPPAPKGEPRSAADASSRQRDLRCRHRFDVRLDEPARPGSTRWRFRSSTRTRRRNVRSRPRS